MRWGILGAGAIAQRALAPAMRAAGHDLAVVGSRSLGRAQAFAASNGVRRARGSYEEVLEAADVDAVYVALPNDLHEPWSVAALEAGKHVLCEKPLALDAAGAARMAAAAGASGRLLMEAGMWRFHPRSRALVELVRSGEVGELRQVSAAFSFPLPPGDNYRQHPRHGGGALLDLGYYGVAICRVLTASEPRTVSAVAQALPSGADATTTALLGFPGGTAGSVFASFQAPLVQSVEVVGANAVVRVPEAFLPPPDGDAILERDGEVIGRWRADAYEVMVREFADAVSAGAGTAPVPIDDAVSTAAVLDRIAAAAPLPGGAAG